MSDVVFIARDGAVVVDTIGRGPPGPAGGPEGPQGTPGTPGSNGTNGINGINGGIGSSAGNAALFAAASGMTIGAAITSIDTAGYSAPGKGTARYAYDAAVDATFVAAYPRAAFLAADGRGFRLKPQGFYTLTQFGAVGDGSTDDLPAFDAALAYLKTLAPAHNLAASKFVPKLYVPIPAKHYYCSGTINVHATLHMFGDGSGAPNAKGTLIRFGDNCNGIVLNDYRTHGDGLGSQGDSSGSIVEGLSLDGGNVGYNSGTGAFVLGDGSSASGHGIRIRSTGCTLRDIAGTFWGGDLININATSGSGGATEGNANNWTVRNIWGIYNDGSALGVYGSDANAGTSENINGVQNRIANINDRSFLGNNTHITPHARDNGVVCSTGNNLPTGVCSYGGANYAVIQGQETAASTTTPGTNSAIWWQTVAPTTYAKPWVSGMAWAAGGPYLTSQSNANGVSLFLNAYAEAAQGPVQAFSPTLFIGGLLGEVGFTNIIGPAGAGAAIWSRGAAGDLITTRFKSPIGAYLGGGANDFFGLEMGAAGNWRMVKNSATGKIELQFNGIAIAVYETANDTNPLTVTLSRLKVAPVGSGAGLGGYEAGFIAVQSDLNGRALFKGDRYYYCGAGVTAGGPQGVRVTTAGTGGTTAVLEEFGGIVPPAVQTTGSTAYTAALANANSYIRFTGATAVAFTIPPNSSVAFPIGTEINGIQAGAGIITVTAGAGVTLNAFGGIKTTAGQWASFTAKNVATDTWDVVGKLA